eukprot:1430243-Rhodomonas_salina.1
MSVFWFRRSENPRRCTGSRERRGSRGESLGCLIRYKRLNPDTNLRVKSPVRAQTSKKTTVRAYGLNP